MAKRESYRTRYRGKRESLVKKYERLRGLEALLATHENAKECDIKYVRELRERIRRAKVQLTVMSDASNENIRIQNSGE